MNGYHVSVEYRTRGQPVADVSLLHRAWGEFIELQVVDRETWVSKTCDDLQELHRWEIIVREYEAGPLVAGIILAEDDDPHVRQCLSVITQYVAPEHRHRGISVRFMQMQRTLAKWMGYTVLAWTHRVRDWQYKTIYRRIQ